MTFDQLEIAAFFVWSFAVCAVTWKHSRNAAGEWGRFWRIVAIAHAISVAALAGCLLVLILGV